MTMGRNRVTSKITTTGPFFTRDPAKTFRQNVRVMMDAVAKEGEADVRAQMQAGESRRAPISRIGGRVRSHVKGRTRSLVGKRWAVTAVVSVNNSGFSKKEGTALMAAASRVERQTHAFRKTTGRMRRARAVNARELLRGIA